MTSRPSSPAILGVSLPALAALVTVVLWASAFVGIRGATPGLAPGALALGRLLVGTAALGVLLALRREGLPPRSTLRGVVVCGVLWFGAYNVLLNAGEVHVDAGTAAMLVNVGPILIALLAGVLLGEGFPRPLLAGCAIAFAGAVVIGAATRAAAGGDGGTAGGIALILLAAVAYAGGVVAQKPLLRHASALQITFAACAVGTLACLPFAPRLAADLTSTADGGAIAWTIYLGIVPTAIGFTTWAYALSRTTAGRLGATTYLVPPLAVLLGWAVLGERQPALALAGGALCLVGVSLARFGHYTS
jgi:drug/metabolite transporter (DMT)-like permease